MTYQDPHPEIPEQYARHLRTENILDIPEHERRFPSHPDTLRGKEERVIEAAIKWHNGKLSDNTDEELYAAVDALIAARKERE